MPRYLQRSTVQPEQGPRLRKTTLNPRRIARIDRRTPSEPCHTECEPAITFYAFNVLSAVRVVGLFCAVGGPRRVRPWVVQRQQVAWLKQVISLGPMTKYSSPNNVGE
jgi:hypothetical protein